MQEQVVLLAAVSILGVLEQGKLCLYWGCWNKVIYARRKYSVPPPATSGHPDFERVHRAQVNSSEYFPIFLTVVWVSGVFFSQGVSSLCGLLYLCGRYCYFTGYAKSAQGRLAPLYFSAKVLWVLIVFSSLGVLCSLFRFHLDLDLPQLVLRGLVE